MPPSVIDADHHRNSDDDDDAMLLAPGERGAMIEALCHRERLLQVCTMKAR